MGVRHPVREMRMEGRKRRNSITALTFRQGTEEEKIEYGPCHGLQPAGSACPVQYIQ